MPDWFSLLPEHIAHKQRRDERARMIRRALDAGAEITDIARYYGCSPTRIYGVLTEHSRECKGASPVERYIADAKLSAYCAARAIHQMRAKEPRHKRPTSSWKRLALRVQKNRKPLVWIV